MSRKDYNLLAATIRDTVDDYRARSEADSALYALAALRILTSRLASSLASDNPRFDTARFLTAAGF